MLIEVDKSSGFCPGVVSAIRKAEEQLSQADNLYCLGDIVHNNEEVHRLELQGLKTIDHQQMAELHNAKVLLRAHGEPPSTYSLARQNNIDIIDATCPVVLKLQQKIRQMYESDPTLQIVIYGKHGHAEVNGLVGQTDSHAIVVESEKELCKIDFHRPVRLYSQTTMSVEKFRLLSAEIERRMVSPASFMCFDTICRQVANRIPHLREFASQHDVILFVSGRKSSNGKALFEVCHSVNPNSYFVSQPEDVLPETLSGESIGICGATSTPMWQMEHVAEHVKQLLG
ncbi:MAG: 4-hydroxy-3-methylbut-2-enyl diphosphate reductase [Bacteroidales bacterium]|nr:4-hydroxy-3-methylbut-2-enyl diphosphate reductase [Bacteroidales bacterium]